jgi:hypothetical protein
MTDETPQYRRRPLLMGSATAGIGSLAGCSVFPNVEKTSTSPTTNPTRQSETGTRRPSTNTTPTATQAPRWSGPLSARPETGKQTGHEYFVDQGPQEGALYVWRNDAWHLMGEYADRGSFASINGVRFASRYATGGSGTPDDPWVLDNSVMPPGGMVYFDPGNYTSAGIQTPSGANYEQSAIYLAGAGIRTSSLIDDGTDGSLITFDSEKTGNFGGVSDMGIFGRYPDGKRSKGNLINGTGNIIDTIYENLIVRYSWGDGIHLDGSASGTRIRNCWVENNFGWDIYLGPGTRTKLSNLHVISGNKGGIRLDPSNSQVTGISMVNCSPGIVIDANNNEVSNSHIERSVSGPAIHESGAEGDSFRNAFANITISDSKVGIIAQGNDSQYANIGFHKIAEQALRVEGTGLSIQGLNISNFGNSGTAAIDISGSDCRLTGVSISQPSSKYTSNVVANISGNRNVLSDVACHGTQAWGINVSSSAVETVLDNVSGVSLSSLQDQGVRTLLNQQGTNSGDPRGSGEWSGHGQYASAMGAVVWDTRTTPWTPYRADGAGNWLQA